eukprot:Sspe_Gene.499::Locus_169_Transcript_1_1_Confidence_1.000_Length_1842::g.499::m.499
MDHVPVVGEYEKWASLFFATYPSKATSRLPVPLSSPSAPSDPEKRPDTGPAPTATSASTSKPPLPSPSKRTVTSASAAPSTPCAFPLSTPLHRIAPVVASVVAPFTSTVAPASTSPRTSARAPCRTDTAHAGLRPSSRHPVCVRFPSASYPSPAIDTVTAPPFCASHPAPVYTTSPVSDKPRSPTSTRTFAAPSPDPGTTATSTACSPPSTHPRPDTSPPHASFPSPPTVARSDACTDRTDTPHPSFSGPGAPAVTFSTDPPAVPATSAHRSNDASDTTTAPSIPPISTTSPGRTPRTTHDFLPSSTLPSNSPAPSNPNPSSPRPTSPPTRAPSDTSRFVDTFP